jgi:hypothetical protein
VAAKCECANRGGLYFGGHDVHVWMGLKKDDVCEMLHDACEMLHNTVKCVRIARGIVKIVRIT